MLRLLRLFLFLAPNFAEACLLRKKRFAIFDKRAKLVDAIEAAKLEKHVDVINKRKKDVQTAEGNLEAEKMSEHKFC